MSLLSYLECDIIRLLVKGYSTKEISSELELSEDTIITDIESIKSKLNCKTREDLLLKLLRVKQSRLDILESRIKYLKSYLENNIDIITKGQLIKDIDYIIENSIGY